MMADVEWNNESVMRLVKEYKSYRELWDKEHQLYRAQTAKYDAWASLARTFECDIADLRKKVNSILASYRRERCKIRGGGVSTWFLYHHLSFLHNHIDQPDVTKIHLQKRSSHEDEMEEDEVSEDQEVEEYDDEEVVLVKSEPAVEYVQARSLPSLRAAADRAGRSSKRRLKRTIRRKGFRDHSHNAAPATNSSSNTTQIDSKLLEMLRLLKKSSEVTKKKDECDSFGEYIAVSLRKHDERTQSMIKQAINNILFEQEMKKYSAGQYVVIAEENPLVLGEGETVTS